MNDKEEILQEIEAIRLSGLKDAIQIAASSGELKDLSNLIDQMRSRNEHLNILRDLIENKPGYANLRIIGQTSTPPLYSAGTVLLSSEDGVIPVNSGGRPYD